MTGTLTSTNSSTTPHVDASPVLELSDRERSVLSSQALELAQTPPALVDHPDWLAGARRMSSELPTRVLEVVRRFRHDAGLDGTLTLFNLPVDQGKLPPTPDVPNSVERESTVPAAITMMLATQLGEVIAYRNEKHGALVQNVVPVPALADSQSNGGSVTLEFHTENAFHPHRPDYVGLLCLRPSHEEAVSTYVASVRKALPLLSPGEREILHEPRFVTAAPPSFRTAGHAGPHALLNGSVEDPNIRVDFHATSALDTAAAAAMCRLREALMEIRNDLVLRPGDMVFLDNRIVVHGRGAFVPRYDGNDRWLHRVFVHLDNRRNRAHRVNGGAVLA
ncbi:TauD/TfdA family dioxygenase [Streptomyces sp. NPDC006602]|uniref:TauD/TfdA family dioxygenase n=1 Tax=Streptomyces sp. NPDC006602 TaxID=3364751 RepID=UPI0036C9D89A